MNGATLDLLARESTQSLRDFVETQLKDARDRENNIRQTDLNEKEQIANRINDLIEDVTAKNDEVKDW